MSDLQSRLVAPCADFDPALSRAVPNISALFNRLLIFDTYLLQTTRFKEVPPLVDILGIENVITLLDSGALRLVLDPTQFVQSGQVNNDPAIREKPPLPLLSFSFSILRAAHYNDYLVHCVGEVRRDLGYVHGEKDLQRLASSILKSLEPVTDNSGADAYSAFLTDLRGNSPVLKSAISLHLRSTRNLTISPTDISLRVHALDEADFRTESNLDRLDLSPNEIHALLARSFLAAGTVNLRIDEMKTHNALSGLMDAELPLFGEKLRFLERQISPGLREETFDRVLAVRNFPSFNFQPPTRTFAMDRFLTARNSRECDEFRRWLKHATFLDQAEISQEVGSLSARLAPYIHGTVGKGIRLGVAAAAGFVPLVGPPLGTVLGLIDMFVVEKIFPLSGPTAFLTGSYASLFEGKSNPERFEDLTNRVPKTEHIP